MDEMVHKVSERTGIAADTVRTVLTTAVDFIKQKLPPQFAAQADMFLKGAGGSGGGSGTSASSQTWADGSMLSLSPEVNGDGSEIDPSQCGVGGYR